MSKFTVLGEPKGKARVRVTRYGAYTPKATKDYEKMVRCAYKGKKYDTPLKVTVKAYFAIPKSTTKKAKAKMESGELKPTKKPDIDNILKIVLDALNGKAYADDKQVIQSEISKEYSNNPRIEVEIKEI